MINLKEIIKINKKYHYIWYNKNVLKYKSSDTKNIPISIKKDDTLILVKLKTLTKNIYNKEKKSPIKLTGGPLYGEINTFKIIDGVVIKEKHKYKNKVYFTKKYLKEKLKNINFKWLKKDIIKMGIKYIKNKLNQELLAVNKI
jgi:hypothetical protein